jgi:hypothetical protein
MKFLTKTELKHLTHKEIVKLWDTSGRFADDVESEYYHREQIRLDKASKEITESEKKMK